MRRLWLYAPPPHICIMRYVAFLILAIFANAQSINISNFYYRDYLDFGQNKGVFKESAESSNSLEITGKNGEKLKIPHIPNFYASSNNGNLTAVGRGFTATANHVTSAEQQGSNIDLRRWGLTEYEIAKENNLSGDTVESVSQPYGRDDKFLRFQKYFVEGQAEMLDITNSINKSDKAEIAKEDSNKKAFNDQIAKWANSSDDKRVLIYQAGSGLIALRGNSSTEIDRRENGETKGGGFGQIPKGSNTGDYGSYWDLITGYGSGNVRGLVYNYSANSEQDFNNRITSGDSGSGFYVYDSENKKWLLLGVTSRNSSAEKPSQASNSAEVAFISNKDLENYRQKFEQKINLVVTESGKNTWQLNNQKIENIVRGDTQKQEHNLNQNKDIIFSGGGEVEVSANIYRNTSGYAGGFVFEGANSATNYTFKNKAGGNYSFKGSGLDIGENVSVEWHLKNPDKDESLHKVGKGTLVIKTQNDSSDNLGTLKIGEGKVVLDTDKKAYDGIYLTSGRGSLEIKQLAGLGATKSQNLARNATQNAQNAESYTLSQNKNSEMGFYFGTGGGTLDLAGKSLTLNTIAANDRFAVVKSQNEATLEIQGLGYKTDGAKESTKANTIIHASIGDESSNINLKYSGNKSAQKARSATNSPNETHLIFDGNINTKGKLEVKDGNVALQGHATAHATIGDENLRNQIKAAESSTRKEMPDYMDLSKPSTLGQPDWDKRTFKFGAGGIMLDNSTLTLGRDASLEANITASNNSKITFGTGVTHFIDNNDGKNITGSGFSYYQKVEQGNLTGEALKGASESVSYKGTISANGGEIKSSIFDFRANLDLKESAKLDADYLTIEKSSSIKLASGTSASVKTLKLDKISNSDLATIFTNSSTPKLKVSEKIWLYGTSDLTLSALDSANIDKSNYDIWATKSSVNDAQKEVSANVALFETSNFTLKSLSLKKIDSSLRASEASVANHNLDSAKTIKNRVYLGNTASGSDFTKLTLSESLKAQNLDSAEVELRGKSELKAKSIEFSNVKNGKLILDSESKLTGANGNANIKVAGENSKLNIYFAGEKNFDINASGGSSVVILSASEESQKIAQSGDSSPLAQNDNLSVDSAIQNAKFSGKISAQDSSVVASDLESITASLDLSGTAQLTAQNIELDSTHNSISLSGNSTLTADKISANNVSAFKLTQENGANLSVKNISLTNSTLQASTLTFGGAESSIITSDDKSKLEITNLNITSGNLTLTLADSAKNTQNLSTIDISNGGSVSFTNKWDFGGGTNFKSNGGTGRVNFNDATYTHNGSAKTISADSAINGELSLLGVGKIANKNVILSASEESQKNPQNRDSSLHLRSVQNDKSSSNRFETLKFEDKKLEFGSGATIKVTFDNAVKKGASDITLGTYYTLISASEITDNRSDKRIDFSFASGVSEGEKFFVVSKFDKDKLQVKFLNDNPKTFGELIKNIDSNYADILGILMEHNKDDESIDIATRTDDYAILNARLRGIDSAMNNIAQSHHTHTTRTLLSVNNNAIDTRITHTRLLASARARKPLYFAYNDKMQRIMKLQNNGIANDAAPSYKIAESSPFSARENERPNDIWLNVGGGYFGGAQSVGFAATNIGYDRLINFEGGDVLVGGMLGFGVSKGAQSGSDEAQGFSESAQFYNLGIYTHSVFGASGGVFGGNELQGNINFSIHNNAKIINSKSAQNTATGFLANIYYKYRFVLKSDEVSLHALKPIALLGFGYNHSGAFSTGEYKVDARGESALMLGLGVEYNFVQSESYYSVAFIAQDRAFRTKNSASVSLNNAKSFIGYTITSAPRVDFTLNFNGAHNLASGFYVQYGIMGVMDTGASYGIKGDLKVGYRF